MTRDDVLNMMAEAGAGRNDYFPVTYNGVADVFERFAALVATKIAADERIGFKDDGQRVDHITSNIPARGKA